MFGVLIMQKEVEDTCEVGGLLHQTMFGGNLSDIYYNFCLREEKIL